MDESKFYEVLGRKQAVIEAQDAAYTSVLGVLHLVVSGEVAPHRVVVDLQARTWSVSPPAVAADEPKPDPRVT